MRKTPPMVSFGNRVGHTHSEGPTASPNKMPNVNMELPPQVAASDYLLDSDFGNSSASVTNAQISVLNQNSSSPAILGSLADGFLVNEPIDLDDGDLHILAHGT